MYYVIHSLYIRVSPPLTGSSLPIVKFCGHILVLFIFGFWWAAWDGKPGNATDDGTPATSSRDFVELLPCPIRWWSNQLQWGQQTSPAQCRIVIIQLTQLHIYDSNSSVYNCAVQLRGSVCVRLSYIKPNATSRRLPAGFHEGTVGPKDWALV